MVIIPNVPAQTLFRGRKYGPKEKAYQGLKVAPMLFRFLRNAKLLFQLPELKARVPKGIGRRTLPPVL